MTSPVGKNDIKWKVKIDQFQEMDHSPLDLEIYQGDEPLRGKTIFRSENLHKGLVRKISGFLEKSGCFLVTGFRGVGKSSVVNRSINFCLKSNKEKDDKKEIIVNSIPMEQSIEKASLVRMIFNRLSNDICIERILKDSHKFKKINLSSIFRSFAFELLLLVGLVALLTTVAKFLNSPLFTDKGEINLVPLTYLLGFSVIFISIPSIKNLISLIISSFFHSDKERRSLAMQIVNLHNALEEGLAIETKSTTRFVSAERKNSSDYRVGSIFEKFKDFDLKSGKFGISNDSETSSSRMVTTAHLIHDLKEYINCLVDYSKKYDPIGKIFKGNFKELKLIFVFDELDRLKSQEQLIARKQEGKEKSDIYQLESLVGELKVLFTQAKANFIFVAGVDMYEKWQFEKSRGDGLYEGIFSENFYINSMLTQKRYDSSEEESPNIILELVENLLEKNATKGSAVTLKEFCNYLNFICRGIPRKLIRELNEYIYIEGDEENPQKPTANTTNNINAKNIFIRLKPEEASKIKLFSGVEMRIQDKIPIHYKDHDINKVLLYFVIGSSFKFYEDGLNIEDWEAFSILPDQEKVVITKQIYKDALLILEGDYIERSFGRKTLYQFLPIFRRTVNFLVRILPHEQHSFIFSTHDFKEVLSELEKQDESISSEPEKRVSSLLIQMQMARIQSKIKDHVKAIDLFKKVIRMGIDEAERILKPPASRDAFRSHHTQQILELVCEARIEIGIIEMKLSNHKTAVGYLWSGVRTLLDYYAWFCDEGATIDKKRITQSDPNSRVTSKQFDLTSPIYFKENNMFMEDFINYLEISQKDEKIFEKRKKGFFRKIDDISQRDWEEYATNYYFPWRFKNAKLFMKRNYKYFFESQKSGTGKITNIKENEKELNDLEKAIKRIESDTGFRYQEFFEDEHNLGWLGPYIRLMGYKLRSMRIPLYFSPKLMYCLNVLSIVYGRMGQKGLSHRLLLIGIPASDHTSFDSNSVIQRLQLAMFHFTSLEFTKAVEYYGLAFFHLNKEKLAKKWTFYMENRMLAGILDMVGMAINTLLYDKRSMNDLCRRAQNYHLKSGHYRKSIETKIRLIEANISLGLDDFFNYLQDPAQNSEFFNKFFVNFEDAIKDSLEVISQAKDNTFIAKSNNHTIQFKSKFLSVRSLAVALLRLGEISMMLERIREIDPVERLPEWDSLKANIGKIEKILEQFPIQLNFPADHVSIKPEENKFFLFRADQFLRVAHHLFLGFTFNSEANTVPHRLGMAYFFASKKQNNKEDLLTQAEKYINEAICGYEKYLEPGSEVTQTIAGAYSDLGNIEYEISLETTDPLEKIDKKLSSIKHFKESLKFYAQNFQNFYALLKGKDPGFKVSLDSLFDTDYSMKFLKKLSLRAVSSINNHALINFKGEAVQRGFKIDKSTLNKLGKLINHCINSPYWDPSMRENLSTVVGWPNSYPRYYIDQIALEIRAVCHYIRNLGGISEDIESYHTITESGFNHLNDLLDLIRDRNVGELRDNSWPLGGYRYVVRGDEVLAKILTQFDNEYLEFLGFKADEQYQAN